MKLPLSWIREFVPVELAPEALAHQLTMSGTEVEDLQVIGQHWERVVVGRVVGLERHPSLPHLWVARVDLDRQTVTLVTAATNLETGQLVPLVLPGGRVNGRFVEAREFGGIASEGMLLSAEELGIGTDHEGIYVLEEDARPGQALKDYLDEVVFDFTITPNRPDEMNVLGIAREVAALTGQPLKTPSLEPLEGGPPIDTLVEVEIADPDLCLRYTAAAVLGVSVRPSPPWMQRRLFFSGMRPISNVVDITNYVMLEQGQPLHAFDRALLARKLIIRRAHEGERIVTLDGQQRMLSAEMLVIADTKQAQAVAGVMGGLASEVGDHTRDVILESANFDPISVRRTSRALRLSTEASKRFERGLDPGQTARAAQRAANLLVHLAGGQAATGLVDVYPTRLPERRIFISPARVSAFLGRDYSREEIERVLSRLEFQVQPRDDGLLVVPPGHRRDVEGPADLAEEVARITGYDAIPETLPGGRLPEPRPNVRREWELRAKRCLVGCGVQEVITYSLVEPAAKAKLDSTRAWPPVSPDGREEQIALANPMSVEQSVLRTTLLASLIETVRANLRHSERVAIFEVGRVYLPPLTPLPLEVRRLGIAMAGPRYPRTWNRDQGEVDFFDLKGVVETLFRVLGLSRVEYRPAEHPSFHPGRAAQVVLGVPDQPQVLLGVFGQLHPLVAERFDVQRPPIYLAELDFEALVGAAADVQRVSPLPRFPGVVVDLAVQVGEEVASETVRTTIVAAAGELLDSLELFDVYRGAPLPSGAKSLAYSLTFRSPERTLTDDEVEGVVSRVERELVSSLGATIRGRSSS